jgi:hypothetical protein
MVRKGQSTANDHLHVQTREATRRGEIAMMPPHPTRDLVAYAKAYARERPEVVALWCFGIGFALGWKLKMW